MKEWLVAGALLERSSELLLVRNDRRGGRTDWSTPGGVIDATDATVRDGLAREVSEETGLVVTRWEGPLYRVQTVAPDLGWSMRCEVHYAAAFTGEVTLADPDGIVSDAGFYGTDAIAERLGQCAPWVGEPLGEWLEHRWGHHEPRHFRFVVRGTDMDDLVVSRLHHEP